MWIHRAGSKAAAATISTAILLLVSHRILPIQVRTHLLNLISEKTVSGHS